MKNKGALVLIMAAFLVVYGYSASEAEEFYYALDTTYTVTPSDLKLALQFDTTVVTTFSTAPSQLFAAHACLDSTVQVTYLHRGFWIYGLQQGYGYAAAATDLRSDPTVHRVVPVYKVVSGSLEFKVTDLVDVQFEDDLTLDSMNATLHGFGLHFADSSKFRHNLWQCAMDDTLPGGPLAIGDSLHVLPGIRWACARQYVPIERLSAPTDPYYQYQRYLKDTSAAKADINIEPAWAIALAKPQDTVAIIDDGITAHEDLAASRIGAGWDFAGDCMTCYPPSPQDNNAAPGELVSHGMQCAGILAASHNDTGIAGVFGTCIVIPVKVFDNSPSSDLATAEIPEAIRFAASKARVISNSWGVKDSSQEVVTAIAEAIQEVSGTSGTEGLADDSSGQGRGCVLVFAAGNKGIVSFPANMPEVIAVGATDKYNARWGYSGAGAALDVMAPSGGYRSSSTFDSMWTVDQMGVDGSNPLGGPQPDANNWNYTYRMNGTSGACPQVAGVAALLMARGNASIDYHQPWIKVREIITRTATTLSTPDSAGYYGFGLVNAYRAMLTIIHGDFDNSGHIDVQDVMALRDYCFKAGPAPAIDKCVADTDCDGDADICDYLRTLHASIAQTTIAPCFRY